MTKLILFDIDGTLVLSGGAGLRAMVQAFDDVFGVHDGMDGISMGGRTDAWIVGQMAARHGFVSDSASLQRFRDAYVTHLSREIQAPGPRKGVMPGVRAVLDALAARDDAYLALLTGNFERGAQVKLEDFDLWRYFACGAFGDTQADRNTLLPTALARVEACGGPTVEPSDIVVIGDTPLDVAVAKSGGARSIAVATGTHDVLSLEASGADVVLSDLSETNTVLRAIGF